MGKDEHETNSVCVTMCLHIGCPSHQVVLAANWAEHAAGSSPSAAEQVELHVAFATRLHKQNTARLRCHLRCMCVKTESNRFANTASTGSHCSQKTRRDAAKGAELLQRPVPASHNSATCRAVLADAPLQATTQTQHTDDRRCLTCRCRGPGGRTGCWSGSWCTGTASRTLPSTR